MPEIAKGSPATKGTIIQDVARVAYEDRGEWYSTEVPSKTYGKNLHVLTYTAVAKLVAEIFVRNDRIWIRFFK